MGACHVTAELVAVTSLEFDRELYPRIDVSEYHIGELVRAMDGGHELPPVVACRRTRKLVDGVHRWNAAIKKEVELIPVEWRDYANDTELFRDACILNTGRGLDLTAQDRLKVLQVGERLGLRELDFVQVLKTSPSYIRALMPRFATVSDDPTQPERARKIPLKASTRHLSGTTITPQQADAIRGNAPGTSYLLVVRQLASGLENNLLPPPDQHPVLWDEITRLSQLINTQLS